MDIYDDILKRLPAAGAGWHPGAQRWIDVAGPDAPEFVHRLCSQDVEGLAVGSAAPAAFLTPKGKLVTTAIVGRGDDRVVVEVPDPAADELAELLDRYHFTEKLELKPHRDACTEIIGRPGALPGDLRPGSWRDAGGLELAFERRGVAFARRHAAAGEWAEAGALERLDGALAECLRILAGLIVPGVDSDEATLGLEADIDDHVSTTKGCYTGQEIVARIHTYGHVNRKLAVVKLATTDAVAAGVDLCDEDGDPVGRTRSVAAVPGADYSVGLATLPELFLRDPEPLALGAGGASVEVVRAAQSSS